MLLAAVSVACVGCGDSNAGDAADAGTDADADDGGNEMEAGPDRREIEMDAGAPDAGIDASGGDAGATDVGDGGPAGWTPLPDLPDGCVIERAEHPEAVFSPAWESCGDGFPGCMRLGKDARFQRSVFSSFGSGFHNETAGHFVIVQTHREDPENRRIVVLARTGGAALAAWRGPSPYAGGNCAVDEVTIGDAFAGILVVGGEGATAEQRALRASLEDIGSAEEGTVVLDGSAASASVTRMSTSSTTLAAEVQLGGWVYVLQDGEVRRLDHLPEPRSGIAQAPFAIGSHVIWEEWGDRVRLAHGSFDQETALYYQIEGGDVKGFATDGTDMAWVQAYDRQPDGSYARVELWTAPHTETASELSPRKVRDMPVALTSATVDGGYYAYRDFSDWHEVVLVRLGDGAMKRWTLPPDHSVRGEPLWVAAGEVGIPVGGGTMLRVDIDAFEPVP